MQFQQQNGPPPYLNARDQRRLLLMVGILAVVIFGIEYVAQPSSWYWLTGPPQDVVNQPSQPLMGKQVDGNSENATRLDPIIFQSIEDDSLGVRNSERGAYFQILAHARDVLETDLEARASREATFSQISGDPEKFRGQLVTLTGRVKQLLPVTAIENDFGVTIVYEAWIVTVDAGETPMLLHFTEIPDGIPTGENLDLPCRFTGYFFKNYAYAAVHGLHTTILLLGKRLHWTPPAPSVGLGLSPYIIGIVAVMGAMLALVLWRYSVSDRRFREAYLDRMANRDLSGLEVEAGPPAEDVAPTVDH